MPIPLPVIANTFRCALKWQETISGQNAVNVIHIQASTSGKVANDAFNALDAHVTAGMWTTCLSTAKISTVDITPLDGSTATQTFSTGSVAKWSGSAGGTVSPAVAGLVKLQTLVRGRSNRGRIFLPFQDGAIVTFGLLDATDVGTMTTAWAAFENALVAMTPTAWELGVAAYDRKHSGVGAHFTGISGVTMERAVASQRRRQTRVRQP